MTAPAAERRVVVVTGGGSGIGAAIAMELGRRGDHVVTVDPMVSVDGTEELPAPEHTTAGRIVAAGGSAVASNTSVTDREAVAALFAELLDTHGRVDGLVNVAGITRPTGIARGTEGDWAAVLSVHLDGYVNMLSAALPAMAAAGRGHVLGVTSGSGWRPADAGAYSCAKRAVASLTWQLARVAPAGVVLNAISPIAMTRMVTAALGRRAPAAGNGGRAAATGGLSLASMPEPEQLAPLAAHLMGHGPDRLRGQVLFAGGTEVALVAPPRLLEAARTDGNAPLDAVLDAVLPALAASEVAQATTGGSNPRFGAVFAPTDDGTGDERAAPGPRAPRSALVVEDGPGGTATVDAISAQLGAAGIAVRIAGGGTGGSGFERARTVLRDAAARPEGLDIMVVVSSTSGPADAGHDWWTVLSDHAGLSDRLRTDAAWARAAAEDVAERGGSLRLVHVVDARSPGGRSRAQALAQLSRAACGATEDRLAVMVVAAEAPDRVATIAPLVQRLATSPAAAGLSGAELVVGPGWTGLRSHPRPTGSAVVGTGPLPAWFDDVLEELHP
ncbi:MAG: SDR family NAD(P)-dependent oxidoreductase [Microthrixaceae bacterium]